MASYEDTFLHRLRKDREEFAGVIVDMAQTIQVGQGWGEVLVKSSHSMS
jgi:hypothetical protein